MMTSEHHGGFAGYLPNPLQAAGFCLDAMPTRVGGAVPVAAAVAAGRARRRGDRVARGALPGSGRCRRRGGRAAGRLRDHGHRPGRPHGALRRGCSRRLARALQRGDAGGPLASDPAIAACAEHPIPMVSAAASVTGARRAARNGAGILFDSLSTPARVPRPHRRVPRGRRHGAVHPDPAGVGG